MKAGFAWLLGVLFLAGCVGTRPPASPRLGKTDLRAALAHHIDTLASDDFGGRKPGTEGEAKTLRYLAREWQAAGLESGTNDPANPWFAPVELASTTPEHSLARFTRGGRTVPVAEGEVVAFASGTRGLVEDAPVVFVGREGERLDTAALAGRVAVMLWDHPNQAEQREALLRRGAAAVIAIVGSRSELDALSAIRRRGNYRLAEADGADTLDGFITRSAAASLIGEDRLGMLIGKAVDADFRPVPLDLKATIEAKSAAGSVRTYNLIAKLPGKRPSAGAVLLLAHWDHFGHCGPDEGSPGICNGAVDNASGLAVMTEVARRLAAGPRLERDVYFLATTAEEWGLLGAQAFAENPAIPLDEIVAAFNLDTVAVAPAGTPVAIVGKSLTPLDPGIMAVLAQRGLRESDEGLAQEYLRRQDSWALLQRDVPAVSVTSAFGSAEALERYTAHRYHQPADKADGIELGGAVQDLLLTESLVRYFADSSLWSATTGKSVDPL